MALMRNFSNLRISKDLAVHTNYDEIIVPGHGDHAFWAFGSCLNAGPASGQQLQTRGVVCEGPIMNITATKIVVHMPGVVIQRQQLLMVLLVLLPLLSLLEAF